MHPRRFLRALAPLVLAAASLGTLAAQDLILPNKPDSLKFAIIGDSGTGSKSQYTVAERLVAQPGTRDYGWLSVLTNFHVRPELLFTVPPGAFSPPPKVDSAAVRLTPVPPIPDLPATPFLEFVSRSFGRKRKTLRNNLAPFYGSRISECPEARLRAEQLSLEQFADLFRRLTAK
jgi:16S rRNA (adenine1518-N6/adenine1519-N6)-dimethyltransferase